MLDLRTAVHWGVLDRFRKEEQQKGNLDRAEVWTAHTQHRGRQEHKATKRHGSGLGEGLLGWQTVPRNHSTSVFR